MAPLSRQEKRKTKVRSISQFYTAVCVDGFVWVHKYTPGERVLCFRGFQNRATTLSILSRRPHPPITFAGFPPAFHLKTVFHKYLKKFKAFLTNDIEKDLFPGCLVSQKSMHLLDEFCRIPIKGAAITQPLTITKPLTP